MKKWYFLWLLGLSVLLTGCSWLDGSYVFIESHQEQRQEAEPEMIFASSYLDLMDALEGLIASGAETGVIHVPQYSNGSVEVGMGIATGYALNNYPLGAYAVEQIHYELGTSSGLPAVAVEIRYRHNQSEIRRIRSVQDIAKAEKLVEKAVESYAANVVMLIQNYETKDFIQMVQDHAERNPQIIMEAPQVTEGVYGTGESRVVELVFAYQYSRDALRRMESQVEPVFDAAKLYVTGEGSQRQKFSQLYAFLMERFEYKLEKSITPAYSLLRHGVGDSRAFATVYAAMCREAGLDCEIVTGTRAGEPWTWNMVVENGKYYHVDLLSCNELGYYRVFTDGEMEGYVWDYSDYPASLDRAAATEPQEAQEPVVEQTEETTESTAQALPAETEAPAETAAETTAPEATENFE